MGAEAGGRPFRTTSLPSTPGHRGRRRCSDGCSGSPAICGRVNGTYLVIALVTWFFLTPDLASMRSFEPGWIAFVFLRNLALVFLLYGGLHLYLHVLRCQGTEFQFDTRPLATSRPRLPLRRPGPRQHVLDSGQRRDGLDGLRGGHALGPSPTVCCRSRTRAGIPRGSWACGSSPCWCSLRSFIISTSTSPTACFIGDPSIAPSTTCIIATSIPGHGPVSRCIRWNTSCSSPPCSSSG